MPSRKARRPDISLTAIHEKSSVLIYTKFLVSFYEGGLTLLALEDI